VTITEAIALYREIRDRVEASAVPVCDAMTSSYKDHLVGVTLRESGAHAPVTQTPAAPGRPPAFMTGGLAASVTRTPAVGSGGIAVGFVAPHTVYAATQEYGGVHHAVKGPYMWLWLRYIGAYEVKRRGWRMRTVVIPERPYMSAAVDETIASGSLERAAYERFMAVVWGE
jgi:hypothetical protein